jgi:Protein of unknown function (DUF4232)
MTYPARTGSRSAAVAAVAALLLAGCSGSGSGAASSGTVSTSMGSPTSAGSTASSGTGPSSPLSVATTTGTVGAASAPNSSTMPAGSTQAGPGQPAPCTAPQLRISAGRVDAGAGQRYITLQFHNVGTTACTLRGYPGVAGLDGAGRQVAQAGREPGPAVAAVPLAAGASGSAVVHAVAVPSGSSNCPTDYVALLVTPPGLTVSSRLPVSLPACPGLRVRAVVAGTG